MLNVQKIFKLLIIIQILILSSAYYIEYVMDIYACKLCKYQRLPFFLNIVCLFLLIIDKKRFYYFINVLCISIILNIGIAFYHLGIERKFFSENQACIAEKNAKNEMDLLNQLVKKQNNGCAEVKFKLFKLSLSELNFLTNIVFLLICIQIIRYEKKQKN